MIAVTFALRSESAALVRRLYGPRTLIAGALPVLIGRLGDQDVLIVHTGVGANSVHEILPAALGPHRLRAVVATGFAGALDPALAVGDVVAAGNASTPALLEAAEELGARALTFVSGEMVVESQADKSRVGLATGAQVVDMETAAIADYCSQRKIPFLAVRAISDTAQMDFPVPVRLLFDLERQHPRPFALAVYLATHPRRIRPFIRFVGDLSHARRSLTDFLVRLLA